MFTTFSQDLPFSNLPITYYSPSFIEKLHSYQDPKEMDLETSSSIFSFLFQKIKEEIWSHPQVEIMRWHINWWLSTFFLLRKIKKISEKKVSNIPSYILHGDIYGKYERGFWRWDCYWQKKILGFLNSSPYSWKPCHNFVTKIRNYIYF